MEVSVSLLNLNENFENKIQIFENLNIDYFHIDLMDGKFVKKNTENDMEEKIMKLENLTMIPKDVHLMCNKENLKYYIELFSKYNPNSILFHIEALEDENEVFKYIDYIYYLNSKAGLVINPKTNIEEVFKYFPKIYKIIIMTVEAGEGGRPFQYEVLEKIRIAKEYIDKNNLDTIIEVDGAVNDKTVRLLKEAGAEILSVGSYLTNKNDITIDLKEKIEILKGERNMLVNTKKMLNDASKNGYAIGAFNITNLEGLQAVLNASAENNSRVIIQTSKSAIEYMGWENIYSLVKTNAELLDIDIALHLDHGADFEICKKAIDNGWTSVMIDASGEEFDKNVEMTKQVVEYAHLRGVTVEAELGVLAGIEDDVNIKDEDAKYTNPEDAKRFVELTNVDSLAIAIGTSHGAYKFSGEQKIRIDILKEVKELIPETSIVLHGASTVIEELVDTINENGGQMEKAKGVPDDVLKEAVLNGVAKINVDTDLRLALTSEVRKFLTEEKSGFNPRDYLGNGRKKMQEVVSHKQKNVFLSANKN